MAWPQKFAGGSAPGPPYVSPFALPTTVRFQARSASVMCTQPRPQGLLSYGDGDKKALGTRLMCTFMETRCIRGALKLTWPPQRNHSNAATAYSCKKILLNYLVVLNKKFSFVLLEISLFVTVLFQLLYPSVFSETHC